GLQPATKTGRSLVVGQHTTGWVVFAHGAKLPDSNQLAVSAGASLHDDHWCSKFDADQNPQQTKNGRQRDQPEARCENIDGSFSHDKRPPVESSSTLNTRSSCGVVIL